MSDEIRDYLARKRHELGLDRADALAAIQATLDAWYPGQARARQLHQGVLHLITPNATVAGELRLRQVELLRRHSLADTRLQISIQSLS
ncbi:MAG TPA: hypothetical protein VLI05_06100 [Candidatus Saccharimonadia bacterium]|nr:hypothetical protein [Candidatus Saccharimonadia bacterium]